VIRDDKIAAPRVSVILPVYNGAEYLAEAIHSVLGQTFSDFRLIVVDDGSTDRTPDVLTSFSDPRLHVIRFPENRGRVAALNTAIAESASEFIARMDADDICRPRRFARQVRFLDEHPEVGVCGTWTLGFGDAVSHYRPPRNPEDIRAHLFWSIALDHPSIMMRRSVLEQHSLAYDPCCRDVDDFDFFIRAAEVTQLANVPEFLLWTRAHPGEVSVVNRQEQMAVESQLLLRQLKTLMPKTTDDERRFHLQIARDDVDVCRLADAERWLLRLEEANRQMNRYDTVSFWRHLQWKWFQIHATVEPLVMRQPLNYLRSPLGGLGVMASPKCLSVFGLNLINRVRRWIKNWV